MGADENLIRGAYLAAGGGMDTNPEIYWKHMFADLMKTTITPLVQKKSDRYDAWSDQQLSKKMESGIDNRDFLELEKQYRVKKINFMLSGPGQQNIILNEMHQDKKEIDAWNMLKNKAATQGKDSNTGFADNIHFKGGKVLESIINTFNEPPKRNEDGDLGGMVWDAEANELVFKKLTEIRFR